MSEEKISTEEQIIENTGPEEQESTPKKRIIRRKIRSKSAALELKVAEKEIENKEITKVLTDLYGNEQRNEVQEIVMQKTSPFFKLSMFLGIAALLALTVWVGFFYFGNNKEENQVSLSINGPTELNLGATTTYFISYSNNSASEMKNVVLNAYFPEGFVFLSSSPSASNAGHNEWQLRKLAPYQKGSINIVGLTYGSLQEEKSWRIFLNYIPANFNSELQKAVTLNTAITFSPVKLSISGPDQIAIGSDAKYTFSIEKTGNLKHSLIVIPEIPENFVITSSSPALDKNKQWKISASDLTNPPSFSLVGKFSAAGEDKPSPIKGKIMLPLSNTQSFNIASAELKSELIKNEVSISLAINGSMSDFESKPGDMLNITLKIKNSSAKDISNLTPKLSFVAPSQNKQSLLKWSDIVDKADGNILGEQIDQFSRRGTITWTNSQIPALAKLKAGEEVSIDVQLPIKDGESFDLGSIKEPLIIVTAENIYKDAGGTNQIAAIKPLNITLNSDLTFSNEDNISGDVHNISWTLNNSFHQLKNIQISATTYGDLEFDLKSKGAGEISYNEGENKITWIIPEMREETDVLNATFSLTLKKKNPTQTLLLSKAHLTAEDSVTGKVITLAGEEISLLND